MFDVPDSAETAPSTAWTPQRSTDSTQESVAHTAVTRSAAEPSAAKFVAPQTPAAEPLAPKPSAPKKKCPEALADEITTLAGHLNAAQHRFLKLLEEFDRHQGWAGPGVRSLAHWLNWKCGIGDLAAREKVRVARALRGLPEIDAAFERGEVSYSKVRAMTRAATPENEAQLLNIARHGTAEHMERLVRVYRRARKRAEASPGEKERRREERFFCFDEDDETTVFGGRVSIEQGRLLLKALDARSRRSRTTGDRPLMRSRPAIRSKPTRSARQVTLATETAKSRMRPPDQPKMFQRKHPRPGSERMFRRKHLWRIPGGMFQRKHPPRPRSQAIPRQHRPSNPSACAAPPRWSRSPSTTSPPAARAAG